MSSFFVLNNVVCPALPLLGGSDGHPVKFVFWEDLTNTGGGPIPKQGYTGANVCRVPDDNGDSWTVADLGGAEAARGANLYLEVIGEVNMVEVNNRLLKAKANQQRVFEAAFGGPTHGSSAHDDGTVFNEAGLKVEDPADLDKDGTVTKQERKQYNRRKDEEGGAI